MNTVFITNARLEQVAANISYELVNKNELSQIYEHRLLRFFSTRELNRLEAVNLILESVGNRELMISVLSLNEKAKRKRESYDRYKTRRWIFLGTQPCYHYDKNCKSLTKDYLNYEIPVEIPEERVEEYRQFFIENLMLYKTQRDKFFLRVEMRFNVKISNVKEAFHSNTGFKILAISTEKEGSILNKIYYLVDEMINYKNQSDYIKRIINNTGFNTKISLKYPCYANDLEIIKTWQTFKEGLSSLIIEDLILSKNPGCKFESAFLEELGLKKCSKCF